MTDKRVGTITDDEILYPVTTISGQSYEKPPTQTRQIDNTHFVVLDVFTPTDKFGNPLFDIEAAVADIQTKLTAKSDDSLKAAAVPPVDLKPEDKAQVVAEATGTAATKGK
jgi:hypothetical protein